MSLVASALRHASSIDSPRDFMAAVGPVIPSLRAQARRLTGNTPDSEDLVQDTLVRAWRARGGFEPGTNLRAWLMRIERNSFLSERRRHRMHVALEPEMLDWRASEAPSQDGGLYLIELERAAAALPEAQRQAYLSMKDGDRYDTIAATLGIAEGTLKSRVARARAALLRMVEAGSTSSAIEPAPVAGVPRRSRYEAWKRSGSRLIG